MYNIRRAGNLLEISLLDASVTQELKEELTYGHKGSIVGYALVVWNKYNNTRKSFCTPQNTIEEVLEAAGLKSFWAKSIKEWESYGVSHTGHYSVPTALYKELNNKLLCPSGLTSRVCNFFRRKNLPYNFVDLRTPKKLKVTPEAINVSEMRDWQIDVLPKILTYDNGVIDAVTGAGKTTLMKFICQALPDSKIVIVIPFKDVLNETTNKLKEYFGEIEVGQIGGSKRELGHRITLTTDRSLHHIKPEDVDLLIFDEVHKAASDENSKLLRTYSYSRMFGLSGTPMGRKDGADMLTEALFGPVIYTLQYKEAQSAAYVVPITCKMFYCDKVANPKKLEALDTSDKIGRSRYAIWRNDIRNNLIKAAIAEVSTLIVDHDPQVLVLVDTVEHAYYLKKVLPDYELVYGNASELAVDGFINSGLIAEEDVPKVTDKRNNQLREDFKARKILKAIATTKWATGVDFPGLDIEVQAAGMSEGSSAQQRAGRVTRTYKDANYEKKVGYVIDFIDTFDTIYYGRSQARIKGYKKKGWTVNGL